MGAVELEDAPTSRSEIRKGRATPQHSAAAPRGVAEKQEDSPARCLGAEGRTREDYKPASRRALVRRKQTERRRSALPVPGME